MPPDVVSLTRGLTRCDEAAWREFHVHYFPLLKSMALARGIPDCEASEIVQRVYLRVLRHAKVFHHGSDFEAWLSCLTRCEAVDKLRSNHRRTWLGERFQQWQELRRPIPDEGDDRLESAMLSLEEEDRRLLTRHYVDGWSQDELAAEQQISTKALESKLARLRRRLRGLIENPDTC
ncbi:sigma-70 family RNA polymerase sigma factor [Luteolibacter sp. GHJ8]|uniref:Sigma-70 family RNA polymerase sigma factor n=1 Tax=Luteolibacter rhizosphaerae TaxID=2989719 RepID=A0ABT3FY84_9BACT|nr:sigma-70 family RNA polymerase sigma factor [Luteolibacter rhizosphaerae]MCW1912377.1 sigma-70 family RNA polymerase sigma factor [Luteolibacter rhizosphaerae]